MIRRATSDDISTIAALHKVALHKHWSHESVEHFLTAPTGDIWVAEQEDTLIGFIILQTATDNTEIISLCVAREHRRMGIASELMAHAPSPCFLEVRANNLSAIAFYRHHGFIETGQRKDYYTTPDGKIDALILKRIS